MNTFIITTNTDSAPVQGAAEAMRKAAKEVYLDPMRQPEHIERLEKVGRTAWSYGFNSVLIRQCKQADGAAEKKGDTVDQDARKSLSDIRATLADMGKRVTTAQGDSHPNLLNDVRTTLAAVDNIEDPEPRGRLWWNADDWNEFAVTVPPLLARGAVLVEIMADGGAPIGYILELEISRAPEILGYTPDSEEWLLKEDNDDPDIAEGLATPEQLEAAIAQYGNGPDISIHCGAAARPTEHGVWVAAWVYVRNNEEAESD